MNTLQKPNSQWNKEQFRNWAKKQIPKEKLREKYSIKTCSLIEKTPLFRRAKKVGIFYPRLFEVNLLLLWQKYKKKCVFPKVEEQDLVFYEVSSLKQLKIGYGRIFEPFDTKRIKKIDLILVPGLVFDTQGGRIGSGKGYYDRYLSTSQGKAWGICFNSQVSPIFLPVQEYDVTMQALCTEKGILWF